MRVLFIIPNLTLGGIQKQVLKLAIELKKRGYHPVIGGVNKKREDFVSELLINNIEFHDFSNWWSRKLRNYFIIKFIESVRINLKLKRIAEPDIIFSYTHGIAKKVNLAWQITGAKKSFFMERSGLGELQKEPKLDSKIAIKNSSMFVTNSKHSNKDFKVFFGLKKGKICTIPNYIERVKVNSDLKIDFSNYKKYLMIGNFFKTKNHDLLLSAWEKFNELNKGTVLVLIGQNLEEPFEPYFDSKNNIHYMGSVKNADTYINNVDVCILSSFIEGCPNVVLEYLTEKKLFIGSRISGIEEIIPEKYHNDLLFANNSVEDCLNKLKFAYNNYNNNQIIADCHEIVYSRYSMATMVDTYIEIINT